MRSWLKYIFLLIGTLLALYIGADMNYFILSSELVYSEIEYCTFILAAVMTVCTAMVISQLKKRDKNDPGDKDADDK